MRRPAGLDRRGLLVFGGAALTAGCATCHVPAALGRLGSGEMEIGDTHAHLFNAADLPVVGFLENVLLPEYLSALPFLWPGLISIAKMLKPWAITAEAELKRLRDGGGGSDGEISPKRFADLVADDIVRHLAGGGPVAIAPQGQATSLGDSYAMLALLIQQASAEKRGEPGPLSARTAPLQPEPKIDRDFLEEVAVSGAQAAPPVDLSPLMPGFMTPEAMAEMPSLWDGGKWIYAMMQPRCSHVDMYLRSMTSDKTRTVRIVNLLVDYDAWLGDGPAAGSGRAAQLMFWTEYRKRALKRVAIETFAPYDPLRHAEDRLKNGSDAEYFKEVQDWADGKVPGIEIAGFKLYPPMGFQAKGNTHQPPSDRGGGIVRRHWHDEGWDIADFAKEIETSLDLFFSFCGKRDIPILAHARNSNEAWKGAGRFANPEFWLSRAQTSPKPLRICLAHFSPETPKQWGMDIYKSVLRSNRLNTSQVWFDLGFADELLKGKGQELMEQVAQACAADDPDCEWFMFGTDWIMLAELHEVEHYVPKLLEAACAVKFWTEKPERLSNLLHNNIQRFLGPIRHRAHL